MALGEVDPAAWRRPLAWVPQRPHLFATSIADNVRVGRADASDGDVRAALREAGLGTWSPRCPPGVDTVLGDRGAGLSAGERQRLALARAFVRGAPLVLLDEPTAGLDGDTELEVVQALSRLARGRTVLVVAPHRPALIAMADRVVSLAPAEVPLELARAAVQDPVARGADHPGRRRRCCARSRSHGPPRGRSRSRRCSARARSPRRSA